MPLKLYDTREAVPETSRATALETKDGKFAIVEEDEALRDSGRAALQAERERADAAEKARKIAEKKAADLEREKDARAKGISDEELQKIRDAEAAARKPIEEERDRLANENRKLKLTDRVQALALKYGVMADRIEDAMLNLDRRTDLTDTGGIVVKDKTGALTTETIDDFLKTTFKKERPWLYAGSGASGSGAEGSNSAGPPPAPAGGERDQELRAAVMTSF